MRRSKYEHYVFSVYSSVLGNYPYYPFIAKTVSDGIRKYISFLRNRDYICDGAELHVIGTCNVYKDKIEPENIQPLLYPKRVEIKDNFISTIVILGEYYIQELRRYFTVLLERKNQNGKFFKGK